MSDVNDENRDDLLASLFVAYDEALDSDQIVPEIGELMSGFDPELARRFYEGAACLALLDRLRRCDELTESSALRETRSALSAAGAANGQPSLVGRFQIARELGRGGLGVVFLAWDPQLHRHVAIKVPRAGVFDTQESRRRFLREAEAAARLNHGNLVAIYEVGEETDRIYLVCEYCAGPSLAEWMRARRPGVPPRHAAALMLEVATAVQHAHAHGVLHRDIKPSNILLQARGSVNQATATDDLASLSPKLTDFGMAKLLEQEIRETRTGTIIGTLAYMSPEQAEGRLDDLDVRTDVYALGAVLYELLTGETPYRGRTEVETLRQLVLNEPAAPSRLRRDLPRDLEAITLKCIARRPGDRYATAHELANDLKRFLAGELTLARPLGTAERLAQWARRRPAWAASVAILAASVVALLSIATIYSARLQSALDESGNLLYAADMRIAFDAWAHGDRPVVRERLNGYSPNGQKPNIRTFAWHFLHRRVEGDQRSLDAHDGTVFAVACSPRGDYVASAGKDAVIRLWDVAAERVTKTLRDHKGDINDLAFAPDGSVLASCGDDRILRVWTVEGDGEPRALRTGALQDLNGLAFSPDGNWLAVGSEDRWIGIWNARTWQRVRANYCGATAINKLSFSPDSRLLLVSHGSGEGTICDAESSEILVTLNPHEDVQRRMGANAFSHDGRLVATAMIENHKVHFWNPTTGELLRSLTCDGNWLHGLAFSSDDRQLFTSHEDGAIRVWDVETLRHQQTLLGHSGDVRDLSVSHDGKSLISGGLDGVVKAWDVRRINERERVEEFDNNVRSIAFRPGHDEYAFEERFSPVRLIDANNGTELYRSANDRPDAGSRLIFSPDGRYLAYAIGDGRTIEILDVPTRRPIAQFDSASAKIGAVCFSPAGDLVATGDDRSRLIVRKIATGEVVATCDTDQQTILAAVFCATGNLIGTSGDNGVKLWDLRQIDREIAIEPYPDKIADLTVSPDGRLLAGAGVVGVIPIWDLTERKLWARLVGHHGRINSISFSPDGTTLASAATDGIRLWDVRTFQEIGVLAANDLRGNEFAGIAFSPNAQMLVASGTLPDERGLLRVWSAAESKPATKPLTFLRTE